MQYTEGYRKKLSKASSGDTLEHEYLQFIRSSSGHGTAAPGSEPWISFGLPANTRHIRKDKHRTLAKPLAPNDKLSNALFMRETKRAWAAFKAQAASAVRHMLDLPCSPRARLLTACAMRALQIEEAVRAKRAEVEAAVVDVCACARVMIAF
jgi:hypothetical protein